MPIVDAGPAMPGPMTTRTQVIHETIHGVAVSDPFRWLEDEKSPEVQAWATAQDTAARAQLAALPARAAIQKRLTELFVRDEVGVPHKEGGRYFYLRQRKGLEKEVLVMRQGLSGEERVVLDPNTFSPDNTVALGVWVPSRDGKKIAFTEKPNASDEATLHLLDVDSGKRSEIDVIPGARYAYPSWRPDSKSFAYSYLPKQTGIAPSELLASVELRLHVVGQDPTTDVVLHPKTGRADIFLGGNFSEDGQYLFVSKSRGWSENAVLFKRYGKDKDFTVLVEGKDSRFEVDSYRGRFYVLTNEGAPNKRTFSVDPAKPARADWKLLIPEDPVSSRERLSVLGGQLLLSSLHKAVSRVELFSLEGRKLRDVPLPGLGTASGFSGAADDDELFFEFSSFVEPTQVLRASIKAGAPVVWAKAELPVDPSKYEVTQVSYPSKDGTAITMFVVAAKGLKLDGSHPTWLTGYGGFDVPMTSTFHAAVYPWLEAGGVYAVANLRGGGEYGRAWHDAGRLALKQNVFDDFAAAARFLVDAKYTTVKQLGVRGRSNGGLLMGAAITQHPELFGAVICGVPLLDMVRYPLYGSGATWIPEYGDPEKAEEFKVLAAYSPYHHVVDKTAYPPLLMTSASRDDRVDPFHARKFVARMQQATGGRGTAWLRIEPAAGHGGADQVTKAVEQWADELAFFFQMLAVRAKLQPTASNESN